MEGFVFRAVSAEDKVLVLGELSEGIYDGNDYMKWEFDNWLEDGVHTMFCMEDLASNDIAGLCALSQYDQGRTIVFKALRTHPRYRGKGIAQFMTQQMIKYTKENLPNAQKFKISTLGHNELSIHIHKKEGYTISFARPICLVRLQHPIPVEDLESLKDAADLSINYKQITSSELWKALSLSKHKICDFVSHETLLIDWVPIQVNEENLKFIEAKMDCKFIAHIDPEGTLLSFSVVKRCPKVNGIHLYLTIHGLGNKKAVVSHLYTTLQLFFSRPDDEVIRDGISGDAKFCFIYYDEALANDGVSEFLHKTAPSLSNSNKYVFGDSVVLERPVHL